ncbi:MAG: hypothetical protein M1833_004886 [Piccolia ochrophora]|nr:MAG: hypothetical protein M1833_004886 [Piccolia ochrophora]
MASSSAPTPPKAGGVLSLYANLLDPSSSSPNKNASSTPASISRAPVLFDQGSDAGAQQDDASAKKHQINPGRLKPTSFSLHPTKRPQASAQKSKPKAPLSKTPQSAVGLTSASAASSTNTGSTGAAAPVRSKLADWTATAEDDDVNGFYAGEKRQRGGRKKRKKNREEVAAPQDWDDIYDPSRPNNYEEYKHSDEKIREVREWKDRLYAHRLARRHSSDEESDDGARGRTAMNDKAQFAPPSNYSFAPPPTFDSSEKRPSPPPPPAELPDDPTGDDAYARRLRLSQAQQPVNTPSPYGITDNRAVADPPQPSFSSATQPAPTVSRAPVRYNLPDANPALPATEAELEAVTAIPPPEADADAEPRSTRPGQAGFAERLMAKYGWKRGTGLGASSSGIVNALRVKVEKAKKKPDSEGGGFVGPAGGLGKIIGGRKKAGGDDNEEGIFGAMSEVIVLRGMVDGLDLDAEMAAGELVQEIGEECGEKYGRVERVFIERRDASDGQSPRVFVKFTSPLSGLRAVNALSGRIFNGNTIAARFFDADRFDKGLLDDDGDDGRVGTANT